MVAAIEVRDLTKQFVVRRREDGKRRRRRSAVTAVNAVTFAIEAGEAVGYAGPNGAGKSTTIKMLTGILHPTAGAARVAGLDPVRQRKELARRIGVVFGQRTQLWWDLPLRDSFALLRRIYRVGVAEHRERLDEMCELLEMGPFLDTPVRQLSLGQRMRGDLAAALLHDPQIVFLDEPTIGLDIVAKERIRGFLEHLNRDRGVTIVLTTHDTADIERLCRRLLVIDHGRVIFDGTLTQIRERYGRDRILVVDLEEPSAPLSVAGAEVVRVDGPRQWLRFDRTQTTAASLIAGVTRRARIRDLTLEEPAIEDLVRRIYVDGH